MILREPVHGDITLTPRLVEILDTREVQRLRGIKQLGTAYLIYPGALHTRFDHSVGTCHLAGRLLDTLGSNGFPVSSEEREWLMAAALLHDVTHIPFGHTFEDERRIFPRHDAGGRLAYFLGEGELAETLQRLGLLEPVQAILGGGPIASPWLREAVAGPVDADLLDYLRRDAFFTGLSQRYDERIFHTFILEDGHLAVNLVKNNIDRPDVRSEIYNLLRIRYFLTERVYLHHAKVAAGAMISKAVELATRYGFSERDCYWLTDSTFMDFLKQYPYGMPDPHIRALVEAVEQRRLFKRAVVLSEASLGREKRDELIRLYGGQAPARENLENELCQAVGLNPGQVIVYCPKASMFKEVTVPVRTRTGVQPLDSLDPALSGEAREMNRQYENLWRFYIFAPAEHAARVASEAEELLGVSSELTANP